MARRHSYSQEVKNELARIYADDTELLRAELAGMLSVNSGVDPERIAFYNSSAAVARKLFTLIKKILPEAKIEVAAVRTKVLAKTMKYSVKIFSTRHAEDFFNEFPFDKILEQPIIGVAYLRGAFLAGGSVNRPEKKTHLEIAFATERAAAFAQKIFKIFDMRAGLYERRGLFVTYIKENDSVCDFIGIIGAEKAVEHFVDVQKLSDAEFEIARNVKEVRAMVNRIVNCETANLNRAVDAAGKQIADIRLLIEKNVEVEDYIKETMKFRLKYPDDSISELAAKMYLSKQGLLYRLKNIHELAESVRE